MDQTNPYTLCNTPDEFMAELNLQIQVWKSGNRTHHQYLKGFTEYFREYQRIAGSEATARVPSDDEFHRILCRIKELWVHGPASDKKTAVVNLHKIIFPVSRWTQLKYTDGQLDSLASAVSNYLDSVKLSNARTTMVVERLDMAKTFSNSPGGALAPAYSPQLLRGTSTQMTQSIDTMLGEISGVPKDLGWAKTTPHTGVQAIEHVLGQDTLDTMYEAPTFVEDDQNEAEFLAALKASRDAQENEDLDAAILASMLLADEEMDMFP
jgi:hypothetical protein